jgi:hypothetical protein
VARRCVLSRNLVDEEAIARAGLQCQRRIKKIIENQGPLHVSNITCSSSGGATQTALGLLRAYNVSWLWHGCSETAVCVVPPEDEQVMLETCRDP